MSESPETISIAYFITPHGFGHAARASAVMSSLIDKYPRVCFHIYTLTPEWFFRDSIERNYVYHSFKTDIGLVQTSPFTENLKETIKHLDEFLPYDLDLIKALGAEITSLNCRLVLCDISAMGIAVAKQANIPSILIENFTWDWIYEGYVNQIPAFQNSINYYRGIYKTVDHHIQTVPVCEFSNRACLITKPVSRTPKSPPAATREKLGIRNGKKVVLITMGGFKKNFTSLAALQCFDDFVFVVPGGSTEIEIVNNLILLPHHSAFYHPDLIEVSDIVIGKVGYSTTAEVYRSGVPFGFIGRANFRESQILGEYIQTELKGIEILETEFENGNWVNKIPGLSLKKQKDQHQINGADQIADYVLNLLQTII
jgi:hypothetical protein